MNDSKEINELEQLKISLYKYMNKDIVPTK